MPSSLIAHDKMGEDRAIANAPTSLGVCVCLRFFFFVCVYILRLTFCAGMVAVIM